MTPDDPFKAEAKEPIAPSRQSGRRSAAATAAYATVAVVTLVSALTLAWSVFLRSPELRIHRERTEALEDLQTLVAQLRETTLLEAKQNLQNARTSLENTLFSSSGAVRAWLRDFERRTASGAQVDFQISEEPEERVDVETPSLPSGFRRVGLQVELRTPTIASDLYEDVIGLLSELRTQTKYTWLVSFRLEGDGVSLTKARLELELMLSNEETPE